MTATEDSRPIKSLHLSKEGVFVNSVSYGGFVTEIAPYTENGLLWFAVKENEKVIRRINSLFVESVVYAK